MVGSAISLGFMSVLVWAHLMFLTAMGTTLSAFFQTTMIVSIPSVVILSALVVSLHGGSIRFTTSSLFALAFLPLFGIGGLTGLPLGLVASDIHLHDTYYVIGHFHYVVAPGTIFALFAGVYHWYPRITGRRLSESLGKLHFWGSLICMNAVFFPMFIRGLAVLNRRLDDGGITYAHGQAIQHWNIVQGWAAWALGLFQLIFIVNLIVSIRRGVPAGSNPWRATTLDWAATSPLATDEWRAPCVYRGPYEYSVPGEEEDFTPQDREPAGAAAVRVEPISRGGVRRDTGTTNLRLGMWLFIASEVMLFGGLFSAYALLRAGSTNWPRGVDTLSVPLGLVSAAFVVAASALVTRASRHAPRGRVTMWIATALGIVFLGVRGFESGGELQMGHTPATSNFWAVYYLLTTVHALHVLGGIMLSASLAGFETGQAPDGPDGDAFAEPATAAARYWQFISLVWLCLFVALYLL